MTPNKKTNLLLVLSISLIVIFCSCKLETITNNPVAGFHYTSVGSFPVTVNFANTSVTPGGGTSTFKWDFGDGTPVSLIADPVHIYIQAGVYQIKLVQFQSSGTNDTVIVLLNLSNPQGPAGNSDRVDGVSTASFNYAITSRAYVASFTNTSSDATNYIWKFGDGFNSTTDSVTVVHTYTASGTYNVRLTASNANATDTSGATIVFP